MFSGDSYHSDPESHAPLNAGDRLTHYRILETIGAGGMGEVYAAEDLDLQRVVALKVLPTHLCRDEDCRRQFRHEAQAAARLNHAHIVHIYEVADSGDRLFFAMERVDGGTLRRWMKERTVTAEEVVLIGLQIADGLQAAHEAGIIHRDIKPSNILIDSHDHIKLSDFGLAAVRGRAVPVGEAATPGTVGYMSPEQILDGTVDRRTDFFSLGIVLYELLAGHRPFAADYEAAVQYAIVNDDPPPVESVGTDLSNGLIALITDLLAKDPARRPESAAVIGRRLRSLLPSAATDREPAGGRMPLAMRGPYLGVLAAIIVAIIAYYSWSSYTEHRTRRLAVLPFENLGTAEQGYFADGVTDAIATNLSRLKDIRVISRQSTVRYKSTDLTPAEIGQQLGVDYLLMGTVRWEHHGDTDLVTVSPSLVPVDDDTYLWKEEYERVLDHIFEIQSDIAHQVSQALKVVMTGQQEKELRAPPTENLAAWDYYLRGNEYFNRGWSVDDIGIAVTMYEQAVALDSNFALAWAMLSRGHASMYWEYYDRAGARCRQAEIAARTALALQPDLSEGHQALGYYYYHCELDYDRALAEFKTGLRLRPSSADLYNAIAAVQRRQGRLKESVENFQHALKLDPRSYLKAFDVALTYGMMRDFKGSFRYVDQAVRLAPDWDLPYVYKAWLYVLRDGDTASAATVLASAKRLTDLTRSPYYWQLARVIHRDYRALLNEANPGADSVAYYLHRAQMYRLLKQTAEEHACADSARMIVATKLAERPDDPRFLSQMSLACAGLGDTARAIDLGQKAVSLLPATREAFDAPFLLLNLAEVLVVCGQPDDAVAQLRLLLSIPGFVSSRYLELDPLWDSLHDNAGFSELTGT